MALRLASTRLALARHAGARVAAAGARSRSAAAVGGWRAFSEGAAPEKKTLSPEVERICDEIVKLNLLQVSELVEALNEKLNLPDMPAGGMMPMMGMQVGMPAAAAADSVEEEAAAPPKSVVNIQLDSFDAAAKIKLIKEVKTVANLGLKEAKAAVEGAPGVILSDIKREEAEEIVKQLEALGAKCSLV